MNKREFMLAAGAAGIAGAGWAAAPSAGPSSWLQHLGQVFEPVGRPVRLELLRVDRHASAAPLQQFTLVFALGGGTLPAGTQVLRGAAPGLALYLEPAGTDAEGRPLMRADCCHLA